MDHKEELFTRPAVDFNFVEILLTPLESLTVTKKLMTETHILYELAVQFTHLTAYFVGIVARAPEDV